MLTPKPMSDTDVVTINPGPLGWPGEAAAYMRACPFTRQGYDVVDVAMDAMRLHGWRLNGFWHRDWTLNDWRTFAGLFGTDHAIPMDNGYAAACSYSIRACITAWEKGYTIRSYYRREDYPPPAAS